MEMTGVGRKVADCVALFSLDKLDIGMDSSAPIYYILLIPSLIWLFGFCLWPFAVPVDTHVFQIASRYMGKISKKNTLNAAMHDEIGNWFKEHFGEKAGWAHSILFAAELSQFQTLLTAPKQQQQEAKLTKAKKKPKKKESDDDDEEAEEEEEEEEEKEVKASISRATQSRKRKEAPAKVTTRAKRAKGNE